MLKRRERRAPATIETALWNWQIRAYWELNFTGLEV